MWPSGHTRQDKTAGRGNKRRIKKRQREETENTGEGGQPGETEGAMEENGGNRKKGEPRITRRGGKWRNARQNTPHKKHADMKERVV